MNLYYEYAGWLYTKLYQNDFFFIDLWSIVHCWSGFVIFLGLKSLKAKKPLWTLLTLLFIYGVLEILFTDFTLDIISPEIIKDQFTDIIVGMIGGTIGFLIVQFGSLNNDKHLKSLNLFIIFLASVTYAYVWVGFYRYQYNNDLFNTPGINIGGFIFWTMGAFATIFGFTLIKIRKFWLKISVSWVIYIVVLFIVEYFGFVIMGWHESSKENATPLLFDLIHGTKTLHIVYILSPFFTISIYLGLKKLFLKALKTKEGHYNIQRFKERKKEGFRRLAFYRKIDFYSKGPF